MAEIDKTYRYWQIRTFYTIYIGFVCFYLTSGNFVSSIPRIIQDLHLAKNQLILVGAISGAVSMISYFISGILSDIINPRYFMAFGLIMTGIANILFGLSSSLFFLASFLLINGFFHAWGWISCVRLLTHWYPKPGRGTLWGVWNTSHYLSILIVPLIVSGSVTLFGSWRAAMFAPGVIAIIVGLFILNRLTGMPESHDRLDRLETDEKETSVIKNIFNHIFKNRYIWLLAFSCALIAMIRITIIDWGVLYLSELGPSIILKSSNYRLPLQMGGMVGVLIAGLCSDRFFHGIRRQTNVVFTLGTGFLLLSFWLIPADLIALCYVPLVFVVGFFSFGAQMLIFLTAVELSPKKLTGAVAGFIMLFAYIGSTVSNILIGTLIQNVGWNYFFAVLCGSVLLSTLTLFPLWFRAKNPV